MFLIYYLAPIAIGDRISRYQCLCVCAEQSVQYFSQSNRSLKHSSVVMQAVLCQESCENSISETIRVFKGNETRSGRGDENWLRVRYFVMIRRSPERRYRRAACHFTQYFIYAAYMCCGVTCTYNMNEMRPQTKPFNQRCCVIFSHWIVSS